MTLATWSAELMLGVPEMDIAHEAFVALLNEVAQQGDDAFPVAFARLITHIEDDFRAEEQLMERIDYPGIQSHREQHARILATLHQAVPSVMDGETGVGRKAMELLPKWFMFHLATMDTALSFALETGVDDESQDQMAM